MNSIEKLVQIFSQFPGIGPRQARRFVYYLLTRNNGTLQELSQNIQKLRDEVVMCSDCRRFFEKKNRQSNVCGICSSPDRDHSVLMLVQRDIDMEAVEKNSLSSHAGGFNGIYFVLGGSVPILEKEPEKKIRIRELKEFIDKKIKEGLREIILGLNWNPEGENTGDYVKRELKQIADKNNIKISHLGKGLSMGTELEYTDPETMRSALKNRA